jgi:hypothetical protein
LNLECDILVSKFAFTFNLCRYSMLSEKAKHLTMLAFEKTVERGKGSAFGMLGDDKLSKVHKARF